MATELKTFRFDIDVLQRFRGICKRRGDLSYFINEALREYIEKADKPVKVKAEKVESVAVDILGYLNKVTGSAYKPVDSNLKLIDARLKNYSPQDCINVIEKKSSEWKGTEFEKYLRPSTLFNQTKFENYVNEKVAPSGNRPRQDTKETPEQRLSRLSREMAAKRAAPGHHGAVLDQDGPIVSTQVVEHSGGSYR